MATTPIRAIPVRTRTKTLRQMVVEADPAYIEDSENPVEYEFARRKFRGRDKHRGPYAED